jgi:hypothetical protein
MNIGGTTVFKKFWKDYDAFLRAKRTPPKEGGFKAAADELAKLMRLGMDLTPAVNKVATEFNAEARALYTFAALGPMKEPA